MNLVATVQQSFAPFADPATELELVEDGEAVLYRFTRNGEEQVGRVTATPVGGLRVHPTNSATYALPAFLASDHIADLDRLARVQIALYNRKLLASEWVAGPAILDGSRTDNSLNLIELCTFGQHGKTSVVILDAPAGMGKTSLVERLAYEHAKAFLARRRTNLTLIISSRGRRLSRLNDAIAATLQDLRAGLFYQEVPILVRHGLINLVIDGFDELVNQDGYDDAWSSLGDLIDAIAGGGVLILSSRDTFFSDQQFIQRAHRGDELLASRLSFNFLRLTPWSRSHLRRLFEAMEVPTTAAETALHFFDDAREGVLGRPFFARHLATRLKEDQDWDLDVMLPVIVDGFVTREAKLLFRDDVSAHTKQLLERFFVELATEMRTQERDWLAMDVIQFFLDAILQEGGIPDEQRRQLVHRAGSVAFLERVDDAGSAGRGFPHQMIRDAFFAKGVIALVKLCNSQTEAVLKLGSYSLDLAEVIAAFAEYGDAPNQHDVQWLFSFAANRPAADNAAMNAASVGLALCRVDSFQSTDPLELSDVYLGHVSLARTEVPSIRMRRCSFGLLDISDATASLVDADESVSIIQARISSTSVLGTKWKCYPQAVEFRNHGGETRVERAPERIRKLIDEQRQTDDAENVHIMSDGEALLDRLARRWVRRFYLHEADVEDEPSFANPLWPALKKLLDTYSRLERKTLQTSGRRRELLHLRDPRHVLARSHENPEEAAEIKKLWADAAELTLMDEEMPED